MPISEERAARRAEEAAYWAQSGGSRGGRASNNSNPLSFLGGRGSFDIGDITTASNNITRATGALTRGAASVVGIGDQYSYERTRYNTRATQADTSNTRARLGNERAHDDLDNDRDRRDHRSGGGDVADRDPRYNAPDARAQRIYYRDGDARPQQAPSAGDYGHRTAGEAQYRTGPQQAAAPQSQAEPVLVLASGNGEAVAISDATTSLDKIQLLVNSSTVTGEDGRALSSGERLNMAVQLITSELRNVPEGAERQPNPVQMVTFMRELGGEFPARMQALYEGSTAAERAQLNGNFDAMLTEMRRVSPELAPGIERAIDQFRRTSNQTPEQAQQERASAAERLAAFDNIQFDTSTEAGRKAQELMDARIAQERAANNAGGGFGGMLTHLFTMLGNILAGKPELNQSLDEMLQANMTHVAEGSRAAAAALVNGNTPRAAAPEAPAPAPETPTQPAAPQAAAPEAPAPDAVEMQGVPLATRAMNVVNGYDRLATTPAADTQTVNTAQAQLAALGFAMGDAAQSEASILRVETALGMTEATGKDGKIDARVAGVLAAAQTNPDLADAIRGLAGTTGGTQFAGDPPPATVAANTAALEQQRETARG